LWGIRKNIKIRPITLLTKLLHKALGEPQKVEPLAGDGWLESQASHPVMIGLHQVPLLGLEDGRRLGLGWLVCGSVER